MEGTMGLLAKILISVGLGLPSTINLKIINKRHYAKTPGNFSFSRETIAHAYSGTFTI